MDFDSLPEDNAPKAQPLTQSLQPIAQPSVQNPTTQGISSFDDLPDDEDKYGSLGQQALTGAEGFAQGFAGPAATFAEKVLSTGGIPGLTPKEQELRKETNPGLSFSTNVLGMAAGDISGIGELGLLGKAGTGISAGLDLGKSAKYLRGAIEMAGIGAGDDASKIINDPDQAGNLSLAHIGLDAALGAVGGGIFGTIGEKWLNESAPGVKQGIQDFKNSVSGDIPDQADVEANDTLGSGMFSGLRKQKPNASEIVDAAQRNGWPLLEGMTNGSKEIQMAEDALLNGPPTVASMARRDLYQKAYDAADGAIDKATNSVTKASETETGNALKNSFLNKLNSWYQPIKDLYSEIEPYKQAIPLSENSTNALTRTIGNIIEDQGLVPGSERYNFVKTFADGISNVDNLQKLSNFRTEVSRSAGPLTKDLAGNISDRLNGVEDRAIGRFADTMKTGPAKDRIMSLIDTSTQAKTQYAKFKGMLQDLGNSLGKKKIYGPQNFMDFLDDLNPQTLARRSFNENNTEFANYLGKNFPDEMKIIRDYQRGTLREAATKEGILSSKSLVKKINDLPPEMQKLLYSKQELKTISDAKTYIDSFPKNFNPSGTSHESAFRQFFEHPTGAIIANLRDFGIQSLIKAFGTAVPGAEKQAETLIPALGPKLMDAETNPKSFKTSVEVATYALKAAKALSIGVANLFSKDPINTGGNKDTSKLDDKLKEYAQNPSALLNFGGALGHYAPAHAQSLSKTAATAVNYLNSQRPQAVQIAPLDDKIEPGPAEKYAYERKLQIAQNPLSILDHIKKSTLLPQDVQTLNAIYPSYYNKMSQELTNAMTDHLSNDGKVPYKLRQSLSLFLGQHLDSTMSPQAIQAIQAQYAPVQPQQQQAPTKNKKGTSKLGKLADNMQTAGQAAESRHSAQE